MTDLLDDLLADLKAEGDQLWNAVGGLDEAGWRTPTPAAGWDVATQVAHLLWTDETATAAATDKEAWDAVVLQAIEDPDRLRRHRRARGGPALAAGAAGALGQGAYGARRRAARLPGRREDAVVRPADVAGVDGDRAVHGDLGARARRLRGARTPTRTVTDRIRHIAHLGVRTRNYAFSVHRLEPPTEEFRIELKSPSGELWTWGPEDAAQSVRGSAYDFCLLVTQRVHRDDTDLVAVGDDAERWLAIAQAFAGPPGEGGGRLVGRAVETPS